MRAQSSYRVDAWCPLCGERIRARDDEMVKTCHRCGALLDVMPQPSGATARPMGEAMASVRYSLELTALERALGRLQERYDAREIALRDHLRVARLRRLGLIVAGVAFTLAVVAFSLGEGRLGTVLLFLGFLLIVGRAGQSFFGPRWHHLDGDDRATFDDASRALRDQQALRQEIARRRHVLDALRTGRDWS